MDLRIVKTKRNIQEHFLLLRSKNALEKIKVKELCENAAINKTTFYKHYQDIYALSEGIENEIIEKIISSAEHLDCLFSNPTQFVKGWMDAVRPYDKILMILFTGRMNVLIDKFEELLKIHYLSENNTSEEVLLISFLIGGASHVMLESRLDDVATINTLSKIMDKFKM